MNTPKQGRTKEAKARKLNESISYRVCIVGTAWEGFTSSYDYTFDHEPTRKEIEGRAGDFQYVHDYQTMKVTHIQYSNGDRRIITKVKDWDSPESAEIACDLHGC